MALESRWHSCHFVVVVDWGYILLAAKDAVAPCFPFFVYVVRFFLRRDTALN